MLASVSLSTSRSRIKAMQWESRSLTGVMAFLAWNARRSISTINSIVFGGGPPPLAATGRCWLPDRYPQAALAFVPWAGDM